MTNLKTTKRALFSSMIALVLCFTMLLGTTFAWFTDSATSADNKIVTGNLDVELYQWTSATVSKNISDSHDPVFTGDILWEPGKTEVVYLSIKNAGSLALKYRVVLDVTSVSDDSLTDVMEYAITPDATFGNVTSWAGNGIQVEVDSNDTQANDVTLLSGEEHFFALSVHMMEEANNTYMGESISFDIRVLAGQLAYEEDEFGKDYDANASYPGKGYADPIVAGQSAAEIHIVGDNGSKVGSVVIPADAAATGAKLTANVTESYYTGNFTVAAGMETTKYDVSVDGLKDGNTTPVKVQLRIPAGLDPATVSLYHYDNPIACTYNPETGYVNFESATFSPFTVVYDADSKYVPKVPTTDGVPAAKVTYAPQYVNTDLAWGSYGQWSPTAGLDSKLEAAYVFACEETLDEAKLNAYANWYCDFYVKLDKDLGENQIFLGGNYGSFGWVGFHNGDLTLEANTEIALLGSVTTNPWTYLDVVQNVREFTCGVGDVNNALEGATFTVSLRLTNPDDETETYDVSVVTYTFGGNSTINGTTVVTSGEGLQDAINNGSTDIVLGDDIDLSQGIVIP